MAVKRVLHCDGGD